MQQQSQTAVDETIAVQAAEWFFRMQEKDVAPAEHLAWQAWMQSDPRHDLAWQRAQQISQRLGLLPPGLSAATLKRSRLNKHQADRRQAVKALAVMLTLGTAGWQGWRSEPAQLWLAQYSTGRGEHQEIRLADGSLVHLNTASGIDTEFDSTQRRISLKTGEILIQTGHDSRPMLVATRHGRLQPLGTRFIAREQEGSTHLAVLQGAVQITTLNGHSQVIHAGLQTSFDRHSIAPAKPVPPNADGWIHGILHAREMRLADFAAELARYRPGVVRCSAEAAELRISGAYQVRDSEQILASMPQVLPVQIHFRTRYWVTIDAVAN